MGSIIGYCRIQVLTRFNIYEDKKDLFYVAKQMGHKNIQTTRIYAHTSENEESEQMEAFRKHVKEAENVRE